MIIQWLSWSGQRKHVYSTLWHNVHNDANYSSKWFPALATQSELVLKQEVLISISFRGFSIRQQHWTRRTVSYPRVCDFFRYTNYFTYPQKWQARGANCRKRGGNVNEPPRLNQRLQKHLLRGLLNSCSRIFTLAWSFVACPLVNVGSSIFYY